MILNKRMLLIEILLKNLVQESGNSFAYPTDVSSALWKNNPYEAIFELNKLIERAQNGKVNFSEFMDAPIRYQSMYAIYSATVDECIETTKERMSLILRTFISFFERDKDEYTHQMMKIEQLFSLNEDEMEKSFSDFVDYDFQPFGVVLKALVLDAVAEQTQYKAFLKEIKNINEYFDSNKTKRHKL
jgi:hypothetical protein